MKEYLFLFRGGPDMSQSPGYSRLQNMNTAKKCFEAAIRLTRSEAERKMLKSKILALIN